MTEGAAPGVGKNSGPNGTNGDMGSSSAAGIPFYEKQRQHLKELIGRRRALEKKLASTEEHIATKESDYLEATPSGNIVIGFDNYVKGANAAVAQRRKTGLADLNRVFSRSSVSYNPAAADSQTPGSTPAPTPMSSTFGGGRDGPSGAPTPNSAGGGGGRTGALKKSSKKNAAAEDSETDGRETKKVRTSFGARK
ncbi:histone acetyltransferase subunit NuA4-domain-containing protein [Staphylotrichum tortipilum]|uniref:Chromatin modification-related protein EAF6 n=1 Tax=Staphylotrichum tortipilum TaxID=2831512 RepID=A0AAN6MQT5_9PEZI|nr:histone acetyltransferase subunit NuA4-domain-containing protein [Staphylotrichum longicolle]